MKTTSVRRNPSTATVTTSARGSQPPPAAVPCTSTTVQTTPQPIQPKTAQVILVQKTPKLFLGKNGEAIQQIVLAQPAVAVSGSRPSPPEEYALSVFLVRFPHNAPSPLRWLAGVVRFKRRLNANRGASLSVRYCSSLIGRFH
uniref:KH_dom_type_1 domain-containing protein n=1 Tax=Ascaris lumbricoides TaxID=6252 RepID=A0A0M3I8B1_ASCLU